MPSSWASHFSSVICKSEALNLVRKYGYGNMGDGLCCGSVRPLHVISFSIREISVLAFLGFNEAVSQSSLAAFWPHCLFIYKHVYNSLAVKSSYTLEIISLGTSTGMMKTVTWVRDCDDGKLFYCTTKFVKHSNGARPPDMHTPSLLYKETATLQSTTDFFTTTKSNFLS